MMLELSERVPTFATTQTPTTMYQTSVSVIEEKDLFFDPIATDGSPAQIEAGSLKVVRVDEPGNGNGEAVVVDGRTITFKSDLAATSQSTKTAFDVTGDADLGAGVVTISERVELTTSPAQAIGFAPITEGAARPRS